MEECDDQKTEMLEPIFPRNVIELEVGEIQWKCDRVRSRSNGSGSIWRGRATCQGKSHNLRFAALIILPLGYGTPQIWTTLTDMDQKHHPRARVYWKDNSIGRGHMSGKFQQIPLYTAPIIHFHLPGTTWIYPHLWTILAIYIYGLKENIPGPIVLVYKLIGCKKHNM